MSAPISLHAVRQATGLMLGLGHPSSLQDMPPAPLIIEAPAPTTVVVTPAPPPLFVVPVQEVTPTTGVDKSTTLAGFVAGSSSIVATPLLSVGVATTSAPLMPPPLLWLHRFFPLLCWQHHCLPHLLVPMFLWITCTLPAMMIHCRVCRNLPFGGRATRDSRDACSTKGIRAE